MKLIITFLFTLLVSPAAFAETLHSNIFGYWKVIALMDATPTTSLSFVQAKQMVGSYLIITPDSVDFNGETCLKPKFEENIEDARKYFDYSYRMNPRNLHLPKQIATIKMKCSNITNMNDIYIKGKDKIIFFFNDFFFSAIRVSI
ncbi:hypothetical protein [Paraherbaspirillum soli]|uniref:Lipocalin-like domain-containing protein n=1 Tax=Paraherbaspirillum soli TaxID=631222 RepID=A0ABW0M689_9BURK